MFLVIDIKNIDHNYIYFSESITNNIMPNSNFIRIYYSTSFYTMNSIVINYNEKINELLNLEQILLQKFNKFKEKKYCIREHIETNSKISSKWLVKISGIWETKLDYGLTYKFIN